MKKILMSTIASFLLLAPLSTFAESIIINVNGMVCAFCAQGLEKTFKKQASVEKVAVDLSKKTVKLDLKPKQTISDKKINELIKDAGYDVESIKRN